MSVFVATMSYDLEPTTEPEARRRLRAELAARLWLDQCSGARLPSNTVWMKRAAGPGQTVDDVHEACGQDLRDAVQAVARAGLAIGLARAWVQASGAGTYGAVPVVR
jgi:hypothetical protein